MISTSTCAWAATAALPVRFRRRPRPSSVVRTTARSTPATFSHRLPAHLRGHLWCDLRTFVTCDQTRGPTCDTCATCDRTCAATCRDSANAPVPTRGSYLLPDVRSDVWRDVPSPVRADLRRHVVQGPAAPPAGERARRPAGSPAPGPVPHLRADLPDYLRDLPAHMSVIGMPTAAPAAARPGRAGAGCSRQTTRRWPSP